MNNEKFWLELDALVSKCGFTIDRPRNTAHPSYPNFIYPVDYGYLRGTKAMDGKELDIFVGTADNKVIDAIVCTIDPCKKDAEIKILYGCTAAEKQLIYNALNHVMSCILIDRSFS